MNTMLLYAGCRNLDPECKIVVHGRLETKVYDDFEDVPYEDVIANVVLFEVHNNDLLEVWL